MLRLATLMIASLVAAAAFAAGPAVEYKQVKWPFDGFKGHVDKQSAQRGYQVYREVCASCHGVTKVAYRNLSEIGFSEAEIKAIAAEYNVTDGPDKFGEMFDRPARPSDRMISPYRNEQEARASNGGAYPPDLSLMVKARPDGANYVYSLLTGYSEAPEGVDMQPGMYYNDYFPGHQIAMAPPLQEGLVDFQDGTEATADQMARDVVNFLQWTAEPEMEARKRMGWKVLLYLFALTFIFYLAKKSVWSKLK